MSATTSSTDDNFTTLELPVTLSERSASSGNSPGSFGRERSIGERVGLSDSRRHKTSIGEESAHGPRGPTWVSPACGAALTAQDHIAAHTPVPRLERYQSTRPNMDTKVVRAPRGTWMLHPHSPVRIYWDAASSALLLFNAVIVPYHICFTESTPACPTALWVIEAVIDWFFVFDLCLTFRTGVFVGGETSGEVSFRQRDVTLAYMKGWLAVDLSSSLPIDFIVSLSLDGCGGGSDTGTDVSFLKLIRLLRLAKLLKLLRLLKLNKILDSINDYYPINTVFSKAATLMVVVVYIAHITACCWYAVGERCVA
jgi:hypothetical protein